jgi:hypothetical protein
MEGARISEFLQYRLLPHGTWYHHPQWDQCQNWTALKAWNHADYVILALKFLGLYRFAGLWFSYCQTFCGFIYINICETAELG